jgi:O-acetyl-ADP-ribose deacetylase (regulator of RNase III)
MKIALVQDDITTLKVDAIVNAANSHLQHGGGVAGAIVRRGGSVIQEESNRIGYVPVGNAAVTTAGKLPCKYVIHAVGPRMGEGDEDRKLRDATTSALERAEELRLQSVALPAISSGIFGLPIDRCASVMIGAVLDFRSRARSLQTVTICLYDEQAHQIFERTLQKMNQQ